MTPPMNALDSLGELVGMADPTDGGAEDAASYADVVRRELRRLEVQADAQAAEIARLTAEREETINDPAGFLWCIQRDRRVVATLQQQITAQRPYLRHKPGGCKVLDYRLVSAWQGGDESICSCGLAQVRGTTP